MPWKPNSVNNKQTPYDSRWQRIRAQTLQGEPLCRLCLTAGRTIPATVVDHITPISDGGTHVASNLQPLCKHCHNSIKTPNDTASRKARTEADINLKCVALGSETLIGLDLRQVRLLASKRMPLQQAHQVMLAASDGILAARLSGMLPPLAMTIVVDDALYTKQASIRWQIPITIDPLLELPTPKDLESQWLRERWSVEYLARHDNTNKGNQTETSRL